MIKNKLFLSCLLSFLLIPSFYLQSFPFSFPAIVGFFNVPPISWTSLITWSPTLIKWGSPVLQYLGSYVFHKSLAFGIRQNTNRGFSKEAAHLDNAKEEILEALREKDKKDEEKLIKIQGYLITQQKTLQRQNFKIIALKRRLNEEARKYRRRLRKKLAKKTQTQILQENKDLTRNKTVKPIPVTSSKLFPSIPVTSPVTKTWKFNLQNDKKNILPSSNDLSKHYTILPSLISAINHPLSNIPCQAPRSFAQFQHSIYPLKRIFK